MSNKTLPLLALCIFIVCISCKTTTGDAKEKAHSLKMDDYILDYTYHPATAEENDVAIILLGGSEGGLPVSYDEFGVYTDLGSPVLALGYFGTENTPKEFEMIPLEYFKQAIDWYCEKPEIKGKRIVIVGHSKGAEAALLIAATYPEVEGVVGFVPSSVIYQGLAGNLTSGWSKNGEPLPFVPYVYYENCMQDIEKQHYTKLYNLSLEQKEYVSQSIIPVENINGPILLFSGKEDTMWPSAYMGNMVIDRLKKNNFNYDYNHFSYDNAGHTLMEFYMMGGTEEGNRLARLDSLIRLKEYFEKF